MIIVTGAAGFIGSCFVNKLNNKGIKDIVLVDDFSVPEKKNNFAQKSYLEKVDRNVLFDWLKGKGGRVRYFIHLGARTDTTETNNEILLKLNLEYSKQVWNFCSLHDIPLLYASSAATYGAGENGFDDNEALLSALKPLNLYGKSKNDFDKWVLTQEQKPAFWAGFKFFNVFGPNEYHKKRMASVIYHAFHQIKKEGKINLFRSHNSEYSDGGQIRDFVYVKDVTAVLYWTMLNNISSGIYNLGTGKARSFNDLANALFAAMDKKPDIQYIDIPEDIRDKYQYYTQAVMDKLFVAGYPNPFYTLENAVMDYVQSYLEAERYY